MNVHSFSTDLAKKIGLSEAIILQHFYYWFKKNRANKKNFYDGNYWTYNSKKGFSEYFEYLTENEIRGALDRMKKNSLIIIGNYNENKYDRTSWYAMTEKALSYFNDTISENNQSICEINKWMSEINEPIPNINTDINTNISKDIFKRSNTITNHITKMDKIVTKKQEEYLSLPEWQELSGYETEKTLWYITQRKEDHGKTIKNTSKAIKPILSAILELKAKGLSIDDIMENIKNKNGCVYQTIRIGYFDNVFSRLKAQNSTNSYKNGNSYQQTETYTPKQPLNDDKNSKDYFSYRFNEDISVAFGYQECIELTNSIIEQKPEFEKVARTKALLEWLRTETKSQYNTKIKSEVLDIYKKGGYDVFVSKAIQENPNSPWRSLLDLLNN